jgi:hypothetical protein
MYRVPAWSWEAANGIPGEHPIMIRQSSEQGFIQRVVMLLEHKNTYRFKGIYNTLTFPTLLCRTSSVPS